MMPPADPAKKDNCGAEFWQLHDVILKMILTGMLIYVPPAERAGVAALVCMIAIANLNYFRPHKNTLLFWLSVGGNGVWLDVVISKLITKKERSWMLRLKS